MYRWNRDRLLMELTKFSFSKLKVPGKAHLKSEFSKYQAFYGLDKLSEISEVKQTVGWFDADEFRLVMQCYVPKDALQTVFLFHGYFDHVGIYQHLVRFLVENGFAVVSYDMPGHGLSSGDPTSIQSFSQYQDVIKACLELCKGNLPEPFHCVGQSTGAAVLVDHLINSETEYFDKVVLLAPLVRPKDWAVVKGLHSAINPFLKLWYRSFADNSSDTDFLHFLKKEDPLQSKWMAVDWVSALREWVPTIERTQALKRKILIVQGDNDTTVAWRHNVSVLKRIFNEVKITRIAGGCHHLVNESKPKRDQVFKAVLSELAGG